VDIVGTITNITPFDWLVLGFCVLMFVLGFAQGVVRRLLGIAGVIFSFLLAANLRDALGSFLASNWTQFPREYSYMLAFGFLFVVFEVIFTIVIQSTYKPAPILAKYPVVDEILGGLLGIVQALMIVGAGIVILDSFFRLPIGIGEQQIQLVKNLYEAVNESNIVVVFRETLLPLFVAIVGPLLPSDIQALYPRT
jgi:membrane protein required for colicin V production